jgi:hypothetical protein
VQPFLKAKMTKRLHVLGEDLAALHAAVPAANLPPEFGGTLDEPWDQFIRDCEAAEAKVSRAARRQAQARCTRRVCCVVQLESCLSCPVDWGPSDH